MPVYRRIVDHEVPNDAVLVAIGGQTEDDMTVSIYWPSRGEIVADEEAEANVHSALQHGELLRAVMGFERLYVYIENVALWQENWGNLLDDTVSVDGRPLQVRH